LWISSRRSLPDCDKTKILKLLDEIEARDAKIEKLRGALEKMLATGALELYVSQFQKPAHPSQNATGILERVYNREQVMRVEVAIKQARAALAEVEG